MTTRGEMDVEALRDALPTVAVSMPARNAAPFIAAAIESVLAQTEVLVDLVVVDDASTDETHAIAAEYADRGVRVLRNTEHRGIGYCHNRVLSHTTAPLIAHVDADDLILPGALARLAAAMRDDGVGQAYCDFYEVDSQGVASPTAMAEWRAFFARHRAPPIDHHRELVVFGMVVSALRTYRRTVLEAVGGFDETLPWAVDYEMALRVAEHHRFAHVPELLYVRRVHAGGASQRVPARAWRQWRMRCTLVRRRLAMNGGTLFGRGALRTHARLLLGLAHVARAAIRPVRRDS